MFYVAKSQWQAVRFQSLCEFNPSLTGMFEYHLINLKASLNNEQWLFHPCRAASHYPCCQFFHCSLHFESRRPISLGIPVALPSL